MYPEDVTWEEEAVGYKLECSCRTRRADSTFQITRDDNGNIYAKCTLCETKILLPEGGLL